MNRKVACVNMGQSCTSVLPHAPLGWEWAGVGCECATSSSPQPSRCHSYPSECSTPWREASENIMRNRWLKEERGRGRRRRSSQLPVSFSFECDTALLGGVTEHSAVWTPPLPHLPAAAARSLRQTALRSRVIPPSETFSQTSGDKLRLTQPPNKQAECLERWSCWLLWKHWRLNTEGLVKCNGRKIMYGSGADGDATFANHVYNKSRVQICLTLNLQLHLYSNALHTIHHALGSDIKGFWTPH